MDRLSGEALDAVLRAFLSEDVGRIDVTTESTVPAGTRARGELLAISDCVVSGLPIARRVFTLLDPDLAWEETAAAGARVRAPATLASLSGRARAVLTAERVALNLLQRMCGIATATRRYVDAVAGTRPAGSSTRERRRPGLRRSTSWPCAPAAARITASVWTTGSSIKDNHVARPAASRAAVAAARAAAPGDARREVEVESRGRAREALAAGADACCSTTRRPSRRPLGARSRAAAARPPLDRGVGRHRLAERPRLRGARAWTPSRSAR